MLRGWLIIFFMLLCGLLRGQKKHLVDTVVDRALYQSFFNYSLRNPLYVTYRLFRGGGACDRDLNNLDFKQDEFKGTASGRDYQGSGYDKGHLANAEDFAGQCQDQEMTFRYYNCVPQTVRLNRGIWKKWETQIRKLSQSRELFVVVGSIYGKKKLGKSMVAIPTHCYKIVIDARTLKVLHCLLFPNDRSNTVINTTEKLLKRRLGYDLMPASYWKATAN